VRSPLRIFFLVLVPLTAVSLPSLGYCFLEAFAALHGLVAPGTIVLHLPPKTAWDSLFVLQVRLHAWIAHWNWLVTLAATAFFALSLLLARWRAWAGLALIPYVVLLCADFTMRWHFALMP
jgi:hypothetical protein